MLKFPHYVLPFRGMTFKQVYDLYGSDAIAKQRQVVSGGIPAKYREFCKSQISHNTVPPLFVLDLNHTQIILKSD